MKNEASDMKAEESNLAWEIDRYLLGDESLDRQAFESRMLEDSEFALLVAEQLQFLQLVGQAAEPRVSQSAVVASSSLKGIATARRQPLRYLAIAACAVAASLLCLLTLRQVRQPVVDQPSAAADWLDNSKLQAVAEQWVVLDIPADEAVLLELDGESAQVFYGGGESLAGENSAQDWLMQAGEFFHEADI